MSGHRSLCPMGRDLAHRPRLDLDEMQPCLCPIIEAARAGERTKIELMLVAEGYEDAAFLVANMTPDGRAGHREGTP